MGIMDGTMAKSDDNADDMERIEMLKSKKKDGSISDAERDELFNLEKRTTLDSDM